MGETHQAYVQAGPAKPLELQSVQTPVPASGQVLVSVLATPILPYTDGVLDGSMGFPMSHPMTPGISAIARVISTGPDAANLAPKQLVFCNPAIVARDNPGGGIAMLHGWFGGMSPQTNQLMEHGWRNGSWAEKMLVPVENVVPLDEVKLSRVLGYTVPELCWINEMMVPFGGWLAGGLTPGATAIVAPATGHFGGCAVRVALAMGAGCVVAVGRNEKGLKQVADLNSASGEGRIKTVVLTGKVEDDAGAIKAATPGGKGADVYIDFSPFKAGGATHPQACVAALKFGGTAVLCGGVRENIAFNYALLMTAGITIRGNFMYPNDAPAKLRGLLEGGLLSLKGLNTKVFEFEKLPESIGFAKAHSGIADLTVVTVATE